MEQRKICAEYKYRGKSCFFAQVEGDNISRPAVAFDGSRQTTETRWCVHCKHPDSKRKMVGKVTEYSNCYAPTDCPVMQKQKNNQQTQSKEEKSKTSIKTNVLQETTKGNATVKEKGRESLWNKIKKLFAK